MNLTTTQQANMNNISYIKPAATFQILTMLIISITSMDNRYVEYLRWKVAVSTMILLDREKVSAVKSTRRGRYRGLRNKIENKSVKTQKKILVILLNFSFRHIPVVNSTGSEVCVEDSDNGRCCVSQNRIVKDIQEVNQLQSFVAKDKFRIYPLNLTCLCGAQF